MADDDEIEIDDFDEEPVDLSKPLLVVPDEDLLTNDKEETKKKAKVKVAHFLHKLHISLIQSFHSIWTIESVDKFQGG